jgi:3-(3-hydroxy-phenyl)propionate hydroxylase
VPCVYDQSSLNGPDALTGGPDRTRVGSPCPDAPVGNGFLLSRLGGGFCLLTIDTEAPDVFEEDGISARRIWVSAGDDKTGALAARYLGDARGAVYLIRPDQHVAARWDRFDEAAVRAALRTATGRE